MPISNGGQRPHRNQQGQLGGLTSVAHTLAQATGLNNDGGTWNTQQYAAKGALVPNRDSKAWQKQQHVAEINIFPAKGTESLAHTKHRALNSDLPKIHVHLQQPQTVTLSGNKVS